MKVEKMQRLLLVVLLGVRSMLLGCGEADAIAGMYAAKKKAVRSGGQMVGCLVVVAE